MVCVTLQFFNKRFKKAGGGVYNKQSTRSSNNLPEVVWLSARRLSNCHNITQGPPRLPIKEKSFKHALNQSSVTNKLPIVFQSNTTQCFIVFQSWTIIDLLFSWLENNIQLIIIWLENNSKLIVAWLENNRTLIWKQ